MNLEAFFRLLSNVVTVIACLALVEKVGIIDFAGFNSDFPCRNGIFSYPLDTLFLANLGVKRCRILRQTFVRKYLHLGGVQLILRIPFYSTVLRDISRRPVILAHGIFIGQNFNDCITRINCLVHNFIRHQASFGIPTVLVIGVTIPLKLGIFSHDIAIFDRIEVIVCLLALMNCIAELGAVL